MPDPNDGQVDGCLPGPNRSARQPHAHWIETACRKAFPTSLTAAALTEMPLPPGHRSPFVFGIRNRTPSLDLRIPSPETRDKRARTRANTGSDGSRERPTLPGVSIWQNACDRFAVLYLNRLDKAAKKLSKKKRSLHCHARGTGPPVAGDVAGSAIVGHSEKHGHTINRHHSGLQVEAQATQIREHRLQCRRVHSTVAGVRIKCLRVVRMHGPPPPQRGRSAT